MFHIFLQKSTSRIDRPKGHHFRKNKSLRIYMSSGQNKTIVSVPATEFEIVFSAKLAPARHFLTKTCQEVNFFCTCQPWQHGRSLPGAHPGSCFNTAPTGTHTGRVCPAGAVISVDRYQNTDTIVLF